MLVIQILILIFCAYALFAVWQRSAAGKIVRLSAVFWSLLWIAVGVVVIQPEFTTWVAGFVGVGRGVDLVIYLAILGMFFLLFRLYARVEGVEREITRLVRTLALERAGLGEDGADAPPSSKDKN